MSDEEAHRTVDRGKWCAVLPMLPEVLGERSKVPCLNQEYSSSDDVMSLDEVRNLLRARGLMVDDATGSQVELLA